MATFSKKSYSRFQGMIDDDTSDDGDAISDARYKQYIQIIYTPVSLCFWLSLHVVVIPKGPFKKHSEWAHFNSCSMATKHRKNPSEVVFDSFY